MSDTEISLVLEGWVGVGTEGKRKEGKRKDGSGRSPRVRTRDARWGLGGVRGSDEGREGRVGGGHAVSGRRGAWRQGGKMSRGDDAPGMGSARAAFRTPEGVGIEPFIPSADADHTPIFTAMTFNVAHGRGRRFHQTFVDRATMQRNLRLIARSIREYHPHIVALQEIDQDSSWNHRFDQLEYLRELTNYAHARHGIHKDDTLFFRRLVLRYGVGILSRLEPLDFTSQPFSPGLLDSKGFTSKRLLFHGSPILVIALHLDFQRHRRRLQQIDVIVEHIREVKKAGDRIVVMGDFNCTLTHDRSPLRHLMKLLNLHTFEADSSDEHISFPGLIKRRLDYIVIDESLRFDWYKTGRERLSDHEYVVAGIRLIE